MVYIRSMKTRKYLKEVVNVLTPHLPDNMGCKFSSFAFPHQNNREPHLSDLDKRYSHLGHTVVHPHNCHLMTARKIRNKRGGKWMSRWVNMTVMLRKQGVKPLTFCLLYTLFQDNLQIYIHPGEHIWWLPCTDKVFGWCRWLDRNKGSASADVWSDRKRWHYCKKVLPLKCCCKKCRAIRYTKNRSETMINAHHWDLVEDLSSLAPCSG